MGLLPLDGHVHTEWSWDAIAGSMERSCARAVELGLASIAFTEHADFTSWAVGPSIGATLPRQVRAGIAAGTLRPPALDVAGYLECVHRCRDRFPGLRILSGVEVGEPHWHGDRIEELVAAGGFERILGSLHSLLDRGEFRLVDDLYQVGSVPDARAAGAVVRRYLAEVLRMVQTGGDYAALAHIDYPVRHWPALAGRYDPRTFEEEYRAVLTALAGTGRALEVNTVVPLHAQVVRWWYEAGGGAVCFGSDAHEPSRVALGFADAAAVAEASGFRPGRYHHDFWVRSRSR